MGLDLDLEGDDGIEDNIIAAGGESSLDEAGGAVPDEVDDPTPAEFLELFGDGVSYLRQGFGLRKQRSQGIGAELIHFVGNELVPRVEGRLPIVFPFGCN